LISGLKKQLASIQGQAQAGELQPLDVANAEVAFDVGAQNELQAQLIAQQSLGLLELAVQSRLTLAPATLETAQHTVSRNQDPTLQ